MPETSITGEQIKSIIDDLMSENEYFAGSMSASIENEFWHALDFRVKHIGGGGLPRPE